MVVFSILLTDAVGSGPFEAGQAVQAFLVQAGGGASCSASWSAGLAFERCAVSTSIMSK